MNNLPETKSKLLSSKDAGAILGYTHDYISRLCRQGKMSGVQKGREWFVTEEELDAFKGRHEIELQEKKKILSKKFSQIRLEHEAKKRKAREEGKSTEVHIIETQDSPVVSIQKTIKFNIPKQFVAIAAFSVLLFGANIFTASSTKDVLFQNDESPKSSVFLQDITDSVDQGIQDTIYSQATAIEPIAAVFSFAAPFATGVHLFFSTIGELPTYTFASLNSLGNSYLKLYVSQGEVLYSSLVGLDTMGANILRGYELVGESFYFGSKDILSLYTRILHIDSRIEASRSNAGSFVANVGEGFIYAKETASENLFKKTVSQSFFLINAWMNNINANVSSMQSSVSEISHNMGAYLGSIFSFKLLQKDSEIRSIELKK